MKIGEVARRAGLRTSAIRYHEESGLLPLPERTAGRRAYDESVLDPSWSSWTPSSRGRRR